LPQPKIHEANRLTDGSGIVEKGAELDEAAAIIQRKQGNDVVVCGDNLMANRQQAMMIEAATGPWMRQQRHSNTAGPMALPHFQQKSPPPIGHTFYETTTAKAQRKR
jgi:hypothetical protein